MDPFDITLILLLGGLVLSALLMGRSPALRRRVAIVLSLLALAIVIFRAVQDPTPEKRPAGQATFDRHWLAGWKIGQHLTEDLPQGGRVLVLQTAEVAPNMARVSSNQLEGLRTGLVSIGFDLVVRQPAVDPATGRPQAAGYSLPAGLLREGVAEYTNLVAVVAFGELPLQELADETLPPLYVMDRGGSGFWKAGLENQRIRAAVAPRERAPTTVPTLLPEDPGPAFDAYFRIVRPPSGS